MSIYGGIANKLVQTRKLKNNIRIAFFLCKHGNTDFLRRCNENVLQQSFLFKK